MNKPSTDRCTIFQNILKKRLLIEFNKYFDRNITKKSKRKNNDSCLSRPIFREIIDSEQPEALKLTLNDMKKYYETYSLRNTERERDSNSPTEDESFELNGMKELSAISGRKLKKSTKELTLNEELSAYSS